jgi:hypothetical protein
MIVNNIGLDNALPGGSGSTGGLWQVKGGGIDAESIGRSIARYVIGYATGPIGAYVLAEFDAEVDRLTREFESLGLDLQRGGLERLRSEMAAAQDRLRKDYTTGPEEFRRVDETLKRLSFSTATPYPDLVSIYGPLQGLPSDYGFDWTERQKILESSAYGLQLSTNDPEKVHEAVRIFTDMLVSGAVSAIDYERLSALAPRFARAMRGEETSIGLHNKMRSGEIGLKDLLGNLRDEVSILKAEAEAAGLDLSRAFTVWRQMSGLGMAEDPNVRAASRQDADAIIGELSKRVFPDSADNLTSVMKLDEQFALLTDVLLSQLTYLEGDELAQALAEYRQRLEFASEAIRTLEGDDDLGPNLEGPPNLLPEFREPRDRYGRALNRLLSESEEHGIETGFEYYPYLPISAPLTLDQQGYDFGGKARDAEDLCAALACLEERNKELNPTLQDANESYEEARDQQQQLTEDTGFAISGFTGYNQVLSETDRLLNDFAGRPQIELPGVDDGSGGPFGLGDASDRVKGMFVEMGDSASAAFQRAVLGGGDLSDVLKGLEQDLIRIALQRTLFDQVDNFLGAAFTGIGSFIGGFFAQAEGGIMTADGPLPLQRYSSGGIARRPQLALFGEGSVPEAYVPVPSGRIPVELRMPEPPREGGFGGGVIFQANVNVNVEGGASAQAGGDARLASQIGRRIGEEVRSVVREELLAQSRPGAMLNPIGAF